MSGRDTEEFRPGLQRWAEAHYGVGSSVGNVARLPGHSGTTLAFDVVMSGRGEEGAEERAERLVVRLPPPGVRREGTTDVLRQVPILQVMERHGVPVPRLRWWGEDEQWFGVPFLVMDFVPGATLAGDLFVLEDGPALARSDIEDVFGQAIDALVEIHRVDWERELPGWAHPRSLNAEIDQWEPLLAKALDEAWVPRLHDLRASLHATAPPESAPGVVHSDFYTNNWLFHERRLMAIVDWEATFVGPRLLDLGWVCMMYDPRSWAPAHAKRMAWSPPAEFLVERYESTSGARAEHVRWYRALAAYRLACLTAHYLRLHRLGRRPDPVWEVFGESMPYMVRRALELARGGGA